MEGSQRADDPLVAPGNSKGDHDQMQIVIIALLAVALVALLVLRQRQASQ
jgi:hypothetical protein